jgi:nitrilase
MTIDPWGTVLARVPDGEGIAMAEIDVARVAQVRKVLPALKHRRRTE